MFLLAISYILVFSFILESCTYGPLLKYVSLPHFMTSLLSFPLPLRILWAYTTVCVTQEVLDKYLFDWFIVDCFYPLPHHLPLIPPAFSLEEKSQIIESDPGEGWSGKEHTHVICMAEQEGPRANNTTWERWSEKVQTTATHSFEN